MDGGVPDGWSEGVTVSGNPSTQSAVLEAYLAKVAPEAAPVVRALHEAVVTADPNLSCAVKWNMDMFTVGDGWRVWVCGISPAKSSVALRFLYGVLLDDPLQVLRKGSSVLMTWDFPFSATVEAQSVGQYVREAVAKRDYYIAHTEEVTARAKARGV